MVNTQHTNMGHSMFNGLNLYMVPARPPSIKMQSQNNVHIGLGWTPENYQCQK